jgi:hypothetical protein
VFAQEKAFCETHKDELRQKYPDKHLIIVGEQIIGVYDNASDAYEDALKSYQPGHFMLKKVPAQPEDDIIWFSPFTYARVFP